MAFYLAAALRTRLGAAFDPRELLDLVALGTIADLVPLVDENRILVAAGLRAAVGAQAARPRGAGGARRARAAGRITAHDVGVPPDAAAQRRRAAGRGAAGAGSAAGRRPPTPSAWPSELDDQNTERQRIQELVWKEALAQATAQVEDDDAAAVVVGAEGWHPGVVGIIAARLVDRFARPGDRDRVPRRGGARLGAHRRRA